MKKKLIIAVTALVMAISISMTSSASTHTVQMYTGDPFKEPQKIRCTCYIDRGTTASGKQTRDGIVAGKREWMGCVAALYQVAEDGSLGEFIGYYEFLDTGYGIRTNQGGTIKLGQSIDVWQPSMADAYSWVRQYGDYVYIKIIRGVG